MGGNWFVRVAVCTFFLATATDIIRPMVSYQALELGAGTAAIGVLTATYSVLSFLVSIPIGHLINQVGEGKFLILGASMMLVSSRFLAEAQSLFVLGLAFAILGAGQVLVLIALQVLVANGGVERFRDARFSGFAFAGAFGQIVGPATGGLVSSLADDEARSALLIGSIAILGVLVLAISLQIRQPPTERMFTVPKTEAAFPSIRKVMRAQSMPQATAAGMLTLTGVDIIVAYMPVYGQVNGLSPAQVGFLLSVRAAAAAVSRLLMVPLIHAMNRHRTFVLALTLPAVSLPILMATPALSTLFTIVAVAGFGMGLGLPMSLAWMGHAVPSNLRGVAVGVRLAINSAGQVLVPLAVGTFGGILGVGAVFGGLAVALGGGAVVLAKSNFEVIKDS